MSVQAFCENVDTAAAIQAAGEDRRMAKAHLRIQMGGLTAAIEAYQSSPTPNVIILESENRSEDILGALDQLAEYCDAGTRVVVIGRMNDVTLYRELVRRGVSDYLISPVDVLQIVRAVCGLFSAPDAKPVGRVIAVVGAKGGVGASTHRAQYRVLDRATISMLDSVVTDLDLAFGTAGLDFNQDPAQGIAEAVFSPDRIDTAFIDRLLAKCTDHLNLLAAPATLDRVYDFGADAFEAIFDLAARHRALRRARRAASMDRLDQADAGRRRRYFDRRDARSRQSAQHQEHLRLPQGSAAERSVIRAIASIRSEFRNGPRSRRPTSPRRSMMKRMAIIPFEPQLFGAAANNGQMIAEISSGHRTAEIFRQLAQHLTGRVGAEEAALRSAVAAARKLLQR